MLWQGALVLALADLAPLLLLTRLVDTAAFEKLAPLLPNVTAIAWALLWLWAVTFFCGTVYTFVFPAWARWFLPAGQALLTGAIASAAARVGIAYFEFTFYWCVIALGSFALVRAAAAPRRRRI
jgi:hypothetical protein